MRSRITQRAQHTATHAHRIASLRRAARNLTGAYVAPGIFEARAPATAKSAPRPTPRTRELTGGGATLWTLPTTNSGRCANATTPLDAPAVAPVADVASITAVAPRAPRQRASITSVPVDWSAVRRTQGV